MLIKKVFHNLGQITRHLVRYTRTILLVNSGLTLFRAKTHNQTSRNFWKPEFRWKPTFPTLQRKTSFCPTFSQLHLLLKSPTFVIWAENLADFLFEPFQGRHDVGLEVLRHADQDRFLWTFLIIFSIYKPTMHRNIPNQSRPSIFEK